MWCLSSFSGNHNTVLCLVLLLVATDTSMEQYEAEVGRHKLHACMDGCSEPLVVLGLYA